MDEFAKEHDPVTTIAYLLVVKRILKIAKRTNSFSKSCLDLKRLFGCRAGCWPTKLNIKLKLSSQNFCALCGKEVKTSCLLGDLNNVNLKEAARWLEEIDKFIDFTEKTAKPLESGTVEEEALKLLDRNKSRVEEQVDKATHKILRGRR